MSHKWKIRCSACRGAFLWGDEGYPQFCPLCGHDSKIDEMPEVSAPAIRQSVRIKSADQVYRAMEESSEVRAQMAADSLNLPASEMSSLKITNLKDNQREGDIAIHTPANPVSEMIEANRGMFGLQANPAAVQAAMGYAAAAHTGSDAYAGQKAQSVIRQMHSEFGGITTDAPSVEVQTRNAMMHNVSQLRRR